MQTSQDPPQRDEQQIGQQAAAWFTRMNDAPSAADRRELRQWRSADPRHDHAYLEVEDLWAAMAAPGARVARDESAKLAGYLHAMDRARTRRARTVAGAGMLAGLLILVGGPWLWLEHPHWLQNLAADHVTARAERRVVTLADGSRVTLDADSAIDASIGPEGRHVTLRRGRAFFAVTHSQVPFTVAAAGGQTRVLGTEFSVAINDHEVVVTLATGSVAVSTPRAPQNRTLGAGEQVRYGPSGVGSVSHILTEDEMAWREGRFVFDNARLGDVLNEVQRYRDGRIVVLGAKLADHRVSGSFALDDSAAALAALQSSVGFRVTSAGGRLVVVSR